jgi:transcription-repair coupling factor (superfamily II helicase)
MAGTIPHKSAAEQLQTLVSRLAELDSFDRCIKALSDNKPAIFDSVWGSSCALLTAALKARSNQPLILVCKDEQTADDAFDDIELFQISDAVRWRAVQSFGSNDYLMDEAYGQRQSILKSLIAGEAVPSVFIASIQSLMQANVSPENLRQSVHRVSVGNELKVERLRLWLDESGFHETPAVELPGEYSIRGGLIDVFSPESQNPVRIELFGDEVESIREFNVGTQRSEQQLDCVDIIVSKTEQLDSDLAAYVSDAWILWLYSEEIKESAVAYHSRNEESASIFNWSDLQRRMAPLAPATAHQLAPATADAYCLLPIESLDHVDDSHDDAKKQLDLIAAGHETHVVARVEGELERLHELFQSTHVARSGKLHLSVGCVHRGYRWLEPKKIVIGVDQLFRRGQLRRVPKRKVGKAIDSFLDLNDGDLVVHLAHGIGRYRGLTQLKKEGYTSEHLQIEFRGGTLIYVPAAQIDFVQKYIGGTKTRPVLSKIGGTAWIKNKKAAEAAVTDMAVEMMEIQAARASRSGIAFANDSNWQVEFEESFPYHETPDQLSAIAAIKEDMQIAKPMDRLLCGDVGFGKTEVAMRAAFKAVESGYQVAVLVPTTVLAEQHFKTFRERFSEFPFDIEKLSRFSTPSEQKETVARLEQGGTDIVIGTHRLASSDVKFRNLGLLIIDEEQRFGVAVKERLKSLRTSVDILTMSATPIPRTLHMSLIGVRDISNLETPPEDRLAVETRVSRFNHEIIREAIIRELNRGGQIYFVHNRILDIHELYEKLKYIVPEASVVIGHGQMPEGELAQVMTDFIQGRFDVLLATTIIESGLDIPNANTIFIDEADRYGLSDLHQLRGRVGRYKNRAYCYLLLDPRKHLNPNAAKRLQAIERYSNIGAGFSIAMRDLEIRGAGNLLGTEQSGHIAAVGYELYCQLLEKAVRELKRQPARVSINVDIDLPITAFIPDDYVPDRKQKVDLYRRISRTSQFDEINELRQEMVDRFGEIPKPTMTMLKMRELKLEAAIWQIEAIFLESNYLGFKYINRDRINQLVKATGNKLRVVDDKKAYVTLKKIAIAPEKLLEIVKAILNSR